MVQSLIWTLPWHVIVAAVFTDNQSNGCALLQEKSDRSMLTYFQDDNSHIKVTEQSSAKLGKSTLRNAQTVCSDGSQGSTSLEACLRLYTLACHHRCRQQECLERRLLEERQQMAASAPRPAPLPEKIYGSGCGQGTTRPKLSPLPTGMEECTFHPKTNVQRVLSKSGCLVNGESQLEGAHCHRIAGGVDGAKPVPAVSEPAGSEEQGTVSGSHTPRAVIRSFRPQPASSTLDDLNDTFTVSVSEVDVDDFLKRQTTFAENREQKLQELRRTVVPGLQMSPGSRRILEQREKRLSRDKNVTEQNLEGEGGDAGLGRESEAGNSASSTIGPCKGKTMGRGSRVPYPGCTFRPKISWRAQKKPSRSLDELSSAELHRREANLVRIQG
ncbi:unnamed protein product [Ostreobium quekettii]|uniref:Uncharacterized protein n=1 Tax=Ostreobium quekettii TaxID=121088 RepID=A0A8S1IL10_9CHLO|nr:unnamed protein product [Ostreobium quekettii]